MTLESCKVRQESALLPGISYGFDDLGRLTGVSDPSATYQYTLDDLGRVVTQTVSCVGLLVPSVTLSQTFDDDSNRTQLAATVGTTADFVTDYTYDALDRVTYIVQQDQTGGNAVSDKLARFAYNDAGDFTYIWRYAATSTASNYVGRTKYIAYDNAGRVTDFKHDGSGLAAIDFDVRYDDTLLDYVTYSGTTTDYSYDSVDQLTGIDYTGTGTPADQTYSYDDSGNRTNTGYSTGEYNQLEDDGTYTYSYDYNGNRERRFDSSGNQVKYFWDHRNRLTRVDVRNSSGVTLQRYTFEYDAYNRLVTKTVDSNADGTVDATYHWVYDGDQAVLQFDGNAAADLSHRYLWGPVVDQAVLQFDGNAAADLSHRYLWGPVVDQLLADETVDDGGTEDVLWAFTDWQGSVRHLASYDESTSVTSIENHKFYDAFGNVASETNSAVDTIFGYTGRMWDDDLDLQNNLNRWYDPGVGRWLTEDPADFGAGDPNLYRYVGNSPGDSVDPSGLANFWNVFTWGIETPQQGWGGFFNPLADSNPAWDTKVALYSSLGQGLGSTVMGVAEPALVVVDTGKAGIVAARGKTLDEFHPWSKYGEYTKRRIRDGATASDVRREALPGLAKNVVTFGVSGTCKGYGEYKRTGDPDAWRRAAAMQLFVACTMRGLEECRGAVETSTGRSTEYTPPIDPNEILGMDPGGLAGGKPSAPYYPEPGWSEWEYSAPKACAPPKTSGYSWRGRYSTAASQPGAYAASLGRVFPTRRNSGLQGAALRAAQEAFARIRLLENQPLETVRGQAHEAGLATLGNNSRLADPGAEAAVQRANDWYNSL